MKYSFAFAVAFVLFFGAYAEEHHHDHDHHHDHGKSVEVAPSVQKALGLKLVKCEKRRLAGLVVFTGRYELAPEARRLVVTPVAGRLALKVRPFDKVKSGDILFTVAAPDLVAQADEIALLEKRLGVYREINTPNAALENELAVKKAARAALLSGAEEAEGGVIVRSPTDGVIEALPATDGGWLEVGAEVVRLVKPDSLRLKALVSPPETEKLGDGLSCLAEGVTGELRIGFDAEAGLIPVYAVFPNGAPRSRVGARGSFTCETDREAGESICVPRTAIVRIGLKPTVFIRDEDDEDRFLAIEVTPGETIGGWTAVVGLPDDEDLEVVAEGAYELKLALANDTTKPAGHFHADGTFHEGEDE